ncbi:MAG: DMT family transporter [Oscillospiraceae bacterium]|nr:DMT family transporter [Oscillospiraceae bacterium]
MNTKKYKGVIYIILSAFFFALMSMFIRLSGDIPSFQKAFFRNFVAMAISVITMIKHHEKPVIKSGNLIYLVMRSICGTVGIICNFYAIDNLNLSDASMLNKMSPFFAIIFSFILLKEKISPVQALIVTGAFIGSVFIVKPSSEILSSPASLAGLLGGMGAGTAYTFVRILGQKGENKSFIVLFFSAFSCLVFLPFLIFDYHDMTIKQLIFLILAGASAAGGQFSVTSAYCYAPAKEISVYDYSQLIFATILGFFVFGQIPDKLSIIGYAIIISMAVIMFIYNNKKTDGH